MGWPVRASISSKGQLSNSSKSCMSSPAPLYELTLTIWKVKVMLTIIRKPTCEEYT